MIKYRALGWDDKPEDYMQRLAEELKRYNISVEVVSEQGTLLAHLEQDYPDFLILDVIDKTSEPEHPDRSAGIRLASRIRRNNKWIPIVFVTEAQDIPAEYYAIEGPTYLRTKSLTLWEMAHDIKDFCERNVVDNSRVFLIYGRGGHSGNIRADVKKHLTDRNVRVDLVTPETAKTTLIHDIITRMEPCGGVVAICTPDDKVSDYYYQPRQNVVMEIGMAMGLARGSERLVILQRWGNEAEYQAQLPSDLGGVLAIRFYEDSNRQDTLDELVKTLKERGLRISENKPDERA